MKMSTGLVCLLMLAPMLHGCGNKGDLMLESDVLVTDDLDVLVPAVEEGDDDDDDSDDEKQQQQNQ